MNCAILYAREDSPRLPGKMLLTVVGELSCTIQPKEAPEIFRKSIK